MYNKSKNKILFVVFILIILMIIALLVFSVYNSKGKTVEQYKISSNNVIYDEDYSYISLEKEAILKKEWDKNYYLYLNNSSEKYSLGTEPVFYDKSKNQITIYGTIYQVYTNGDVSEKTEKTVISSVNDFQFFKLNDRKYLMIGEKIKSDNFATTNYLIVSIDKAGNALLLNNSVNIKTINPLVLNVGDFSFDVANEKLINGEKEIDLKKINGSTNEYVQKEETEDNNNTGGDNNSDSNNTNNNNNNNNNINNSSSNNSQIYNDIVNQIINLTGIISSSGNKTNLYKNISLRSVTPGASYLDISYSVIDPEEKYLSVFLALKDSNGNVDYHYLNKESDTYKITGLLPSSQYEVTINYIVAGSSESVVADSIKVLTSNDPTVVRINKIIGNMIFYNVKMYNEYEFASAYVTLTNCDGGTIGITQLNITNALSLTGDSGSFTIASETIPEYVCLNLTNVKDYYDNDVEINSYHKIKID